MVVHPIIWSSHFASSTAIFIKILLFYPLLPSIAQTVRHVLRHEGLALTTTVSKSHWTSWAVLILKGHVLR